MRMYKGWTVTRVLHNGMWSAHKVGELPLLADTLAGLKWLVSNPEEVEAARKRVYG